MKFLFLIAFILFSFCYKIKYIHDFILGIPKDSCSWGRSSNNYWQRNILWKTILPIFLAQLFILQVEVVYKAIIADSYVTIWQKRIWKSEYFWISVVDANNIFHVQFSYVADNFINTFMRSQVIIFLIKKSKS